MQAKTQARTRLSTVPDEDLLRRARTGDAAALGELFAALRPSLMAQVRRYVGKDHVDDVISETYVKVLHAMRRRNQPAERQRSQPVERPQAYIMHAAKTTAWRHQRTLTNERVKAIRQGQGIQIACPDPALSDGDLSRAMRSLSPRYREVLWWTEVEGMTATEVGDRIGVAPNAAAALAYRARAALRRQYGELGA